MCSRRRPTQGAVPGAEVGFICPGEEDPVPPELVKVDGERPDAALGHLAVQLLGALHVGAAAVAAVGLLAAKVELQVGRLSQKKHNMKENVQCKNVYKSFIYCKRYCIYSKSYWLLLQDTAFVFFASSL